MKQEFAIELAQSALVWLAGEPDALGAFLSASGTDPDTLRSRAGDPEFLGSVLDFLLGSDEMVLSFAAAESIAPTLPAAARAALPGGDAPWWT